MFDNGPDDKDILEVKNGDRHAIIMRCGRCKKWQGVFFNGMRYAGRAEGGYYVLRGHAHEFVYGQAPQAPEAA